MLLSKCYGGEMVEMVPAMTHRSQPETGGDCSWEAGPRGGGAARYYSNYTTVDGMLGKINCVVRITAITHSNS